MSGFLIAGLPAQESQRAARCVFERKGLRCAEELSIGGDTLVLFGRGGSENCHHVQLPNGDWAAVVGTFMFSNRTGRAGLEALLATDRGLLDLESELAGNYVLFLYRGGRLQMIQDRCGYYQVYRSADGRRLSTSLLALAAGEARERPSAQEFYEYVFYGFNFGRRTLLPGIQLVDHDHVWDCDADAPGASRPLLHDTLPPGSSFRDRLDAVRANLLDYFDALGTCFDGSFTSALSGGYDSRLMLALLRNLGHSPHLYVYGGPNHPDVTIAKAIAKGEGLALEHIDKGATPRPDVDTWLEILKRDYHFFDGLKATGIFDDGSDYSTRVDRAGKARLQINGAGGEIYRDIWNLPNRSIAIERFLHARYDYGDFSFCTDRFDGRAFYARLGEKVQEILGIRRGRITRLEMEKLFPLLRNRFAGANTALNNQLGPSILPYMEPRFVEQSYGIPMRFKDYGRFHAALIASLDPALASYPSNYGRNFSDPISMKTKLRVQLRRNVPVGLRLARRRRRYAGRPLPYYLEGEYRDALFGKGELAISEFLDVDRIHDPVKRARALTVELVLRGGPDT